MRNDVHGMHNILTLHIYKQFLMLLWPCDCSPAGIRAKKGKTTGRISSNKVVWGWKGWKGELSTSVSPSLSSGDAGGCDQWCRKLYPTGRISLEKVAQGWKGRKELSKSVAILHCWYQHHVSHRTRHFIYQLLHVWHALTYFLQPVTILRVKRVKV